jgi:hypothetical protein
MIAVNLVQALEPELTLNYAQQLITCENWLARRGIASVQWRSMGMSVSAGCLDIRTDYGVALPMLKNQLTRASWLGTESEPWVGASWFDQLAASEYITPKNRHPNLSAVAVQAGRITDHLAVLGLV